jgi:hypothetical protein
MMRERMEDDGTALTHLDLLTDLGGEFEGRLEVLADEWNEAKTLGEDLKHLPRLTEGGHRRGSSASNTGARERGGQDQAEKARGPSEVERVPDPGGASSFLQRFRVSPVREWGRSIRIPFSPILR